MFAHCVEKSSELEKAEKMVALLNSNQDLRAQGYSFVAKNAGSMDALVDMLEDGSCHIAELDAGKAYGVSNSPKLNFGDKKVHPIGAEGSGSYVTMAVARKDK